MEILTKSQIATPLGAMILICRGDSLVSADFDNDWARSLGLLERRFGSCRLDSVAAPAAVVCAFAGYFDGDFSSFEGLALETRGTAFQETVWRALRATRAGERLSYGEMATRLGRPQAARAVGLANSHNPLAVVTPCHRLVGKDGQLTGYAGGLDRKAWLLAHEAASGVGL